MYSLFVSAAAGIKNIHSDKVEGEKGRGCVARDLFVPIKGLNLFFPDPLRPQRVAC
jgi:hypothetical protein